MKTKEMQLKIKRNNKPVSQEVKEHVKEYLVNHLPNYELVDVVRKSDHPEDDYLYMVSAKNNNGTYAVWTSWNETTGSLNFGHYGLEDLESCPKLFNEYFHRIAGENVED